MKMDVVQDSEIVLKMNRLYNQASSSDFAMLLILVDYYTEALLCASKDFGQLYYSLPTFSRQYATYHGVKIEPLERNPIHGDPAKLFCMSIKCQKRNGRIVYFDDDDTHQCFL